MLRMALEFLIPVMYDARVKFRIQSYKLTW